MAELVDAQDLGSCGATRGGSSPSGRILLLASLCALGPAALSAQHDFNALDSATQAELRRARIPGAALVIVRGDRIVHVRGFGSADPSGRPVTPQTPFYLGSTTKSVTALAIVQLASQGRLDLDSPVQGYLPWFTLADSGVSRAITVRQLLLHRGRIPGRAGERFLSDRDTSPDAAERHIRWLARVKPGSGFDYSNLGFTTLGLIVEAASGQSYATYLRTHVFEPLGMLHTYTERDEARRNGLAAGYSMVLGFPLRVDQPADRGDLAAGYLISCAEDVGRYLIAQLNHGQVPGFPGIDGAVIDSMHRSRGPIVPDRDITFGFSETKLEGVRVLDISGSVPTYLSRFVLSPDSGWGIALLANGNGAIAEAHVMEAALNAARLTMGKPANAAAVPIWIRLAIGLFLGLPLLQMAWMVRKAARLRRFPRAAKPLWRTALAALPAALWGLLVLLGLPVLFGTYWPTMFAYQPDIAVAMFASGVLGLIWSAGRLGFSVRSAGRGT